MAFIPCFDATSPEALARAEVRGVAFVSDSHESAARLSLDYQRAGGKGTCFALTASDVTHALETGELSHLALDKPAARRNRSVAEWLGIGHRRGLAVGLVC